VTPADDAPAPAPEDGASASGRKTKAPQDELAIAVLRLAETQQKQFAAFRDHLDAFGARMTALEAGLTARAPDRGPAPMFEAQKAGFEHLLTGFRLALRDVADLPARIERAEQSLQANAAALQKMSENMAEAAAAPRPAGGGARFEAEKVGFERILTGFRLVLRDLGRQVAKSADGERAAAPAPAEAPPIFDLGPVESRLDTLAARLQAMEEALAQRPTPAEPSRAPARFEAEKVGFERILTGFRLVLRDLGQQVAKADAEGAAPAEAAAVDLGPVESRLDLVLSRLQAIEDAQAARPALPDPPRAIARFEAEKVGFERILTGFRLVLRDLGQQVGKGAAGPGVDGGTDTPVDARPETPAVDFSPLDARLESVSARLQAIEETLSARPAADPTRAVARFEAEKVGFERMLIGFRLVLRDLSEQAARVSAPASAGAPDPATNETLAAILARLESVEAALATRTEPERPRASALFEAEKVGFERLLEGFRMVLRDFGQQARDGGAEKILQQLEALGRRLESAEASPVVPALAALDARLEGLAQRLEIASEAPPPLTPARDAPPFDPKKLEYAHLRAGVTLVMRQVEQAAQRLDAVVGRLGEAEIRLAPVATTEALARDDNAAEPARLSLHRLLGGYRFILVALQREAERLQSATARAPGALDEGAARIEAAAARLEALTQAPRSSSDPASLDEAILRLKTLGLRMASKIGAEGQEPAEDLRGQTVELLAISDALAEEMRRRA